jgi:hypothetical protein
VADPLGQVANGVSAWAAISGRGPVAEHRTEALLQFEPIARCGALRRRNLKFVSTVRFECFFAHARVCVLKKAVLSSAL